MSLNWGAIERASMKAEYILSSIYQKKNFRFSHIFLRLFKCIAWFWTVHLIQYETFLALISYLVSSYLPGTSILEPFYDPL